MNKEELKSSHTPPQYFVERGMVLGNQIVLTGGPLKHAKAQRLREGEAFRAVLGDALYSAKVSEVLPDRIVAEIVGRTRLGEASWKVHLFASLLKGQNFDLVVEKATEIGVTSIVPVVTSRTIPRLDPDKAAERRLRWQKIAKAASEQSGRGTAPVIGEVASLTSLLEAATSACGKDRVGHGPASDLEGILTPVPGPTRDFVIPGVRLLAYEHQEMTVPLAGALRDVAETSVLVGPEGGLDSLEVETVLSSGFVPVSLGPYIMKAETASIAAVSLLVHYLSNRG